MKQTIFLFLAGCLLQTAAFAQTPTVVEVQKTARQYMMRADWENAIKVLTEAQVAYPGNLDVEKELAQAYYYRRDFEKAISLSKQLIARPDADVPCFQLAANAYKGIESLKEAEKVLRKGLDKYPESGPLYAELGELLFVQKDNSAINLWEKGIVKDPNYPANYFHAARFYYLSTDLAWSIIYGEMFVNMESYSERAKEMQQVLLDSYTKLYANKNIAKAASSGKYSDFAKSYLVQMDRYTDLAKEKGITPQSLMDIRKWFIQNWFVNEAAKFPFRLFDHQKQMIDQGLWEAYNWWLFATPTYASALENFKRTEADKWAKFDYFQRGRVYKQPANQYYH